MKKIHQLLLRLFEAVALPRTKYTVAVEDCKNGTVAKYTNHQILPIRSQEN